VHISEKQLRKLVAIPNVCVAVAADLGASLRKVTALPFNELQAVAEHADWWFKNYTNLVMTYAPQDDNEPNPIQIFGSRGIYCVTVLDCPSMYFETIKAAKKYGDEQVSQFFVDDV
jgi:hypothetical protein